MAPCLQRHQRRSHGGGDTLALDNAGALTFDAANTINFEFLQKDNVGTATLTGSQDYVGGADAQRRRP